MPLGSRSCGSALTQSIDFNSVDVLADVTALPWQQMQLAQHASLPQDDSDVDELALVSLGLGAAPFSMQA
jgi:hypothetical protein